MDFQNRNAAGTGSFLGLPRVADLAQLDADVAILGIPYGAPYSMAGLHGHSAKAPEAIRAASVRAFDGFDHWDFDLGGTLLDGKPVRMVDCGDVPGDPQDIAATCRRATDAVKTILDRGALPIMFGGDHSISCQTFKAYETHGPVTIVQVDAHLDWRHEVSGVTEGYSSPMRRASEMPWVEGMVQIGLRGTGSARQQELRDALAYGSVIVTARELREQGMARVLERIPAGRDYIITIDCDGVDPTVMPAVEGPTPGGPGYPEMAQLMEGLARRGRVVGFDLVELVPHRDLNEIAAIAACRIVLELIGWLVRTGRFGNR